MFMLKNSIKEAKAVLSYNYLEKITENSLAIEQSDSKKKYFKIKFQ